MGAGEIAYTISRLVLGAACSFCAIILWTKTRDAPWTLMVLGILAAYMEIVYSVLVRAGISVGLPVLMPILLSNLPIVFFIAAFLAMILRKSR